MRNPIDEHFEKGLESLEITPRADLWKQSIAPQLVPEKSKPVFWYRAAAIFIFLLCGLFALNYFGKNNQKPGQLPEQPVAVEVVPTAVPATEIAPIEVENIEEKPAEIAHQPAGKNPLKTKNKSAAKTVLAKVEAENTNEKMIAAVTEIGETEVKSKPTYKVKMSINTSKYADAALALEEDAAGENVKTYAANQWENLKNGEKLNAPPKEWFNLPKLAVRVEGNPLKGVLNP